MRRRFIHVIDEVLIDECPSGCGIWLNGDEFEDMREQFEQAFAEGSLTQDVCNDSDLHDDTGTTDAQAQRDRCFRNACRFLCAVNDVQRNQA
jgi:Zn-finger nucleic acid-binding protein